MSETGNSRKTDTPPLQVLQSSCLTVKAIAAIVPRWRPLTAPRQPHAASLSSNFERFFHNTETPNRSKRGESRKQKRKQTPSLAHKHNYTEERVINLVVGNQGSSYFPYRAQTETLREPTVNQRREAGNSYYKPEIVYFAARQIKMSARCGFVDVNELARLFIMIAEIYGRL